MRLLGPGQDVLIAENREGQPSDPNLGVAKLAPKNENRFFVGQNETSLLDVARCSFCLSTNSYKNWGLIPSYHLKTVPKASSNILGKRENF